MKRIFVYVLAALAGAALFGLLVHAILVATQLSTPAAATVYGATPRRLWATGTIALAAAGAGLAALALRRSLKRVGPGRGKNGATVAAVLGLVAIASGGTNLAMANGGPGTGNGVVGAAMAVVLGLVALVLATLVLIRSRRIV
ncbi:MAG TPA: DUF6223 family protein [Lacunisphaera sp.]